MPLYDFHCEPCDITTEKLQSFSAPAPTCACGAAMQRMPSRCSFKVNGFSSINGFTGPRTISQRHANGIRTEVKGNFEAFSNGLHS